MSLTTGRAGLIIREKLESNASDTPNSVRKVQKKIADLPVADLGQSASEVFRLLFDLNQSHFSAKERLQLLEATRPICNELVTSLSETYIHSPLNHAPKLRSAAELVHALASEQVFGYNAVIEELLSDSWLTEKYQKSLLPAACANSLHGQGLIQLQRYQLYKTVGSKLWHQQNLLFALAQKYDLFDLKLKGASTDLHSIEHQLKKNIALSTCNPFQMKHGMVNESYQIVDKLASTIDIEPSVTKSCLYAYSIDKDIGPQLTDSIDSESNDWLGINLNDALNSVINNSIESQEGFLNLFKRTTELEITDALKTHLTENWKAVKSRNFIRVRSNDSTKVAIGMAASHHFLIEQGGEELRDRFFGQKKSQSIFQSSGSLSLVEEDSSQHSFVWQKESSLGFINSNQKKPDAFKSIYKPRNLEKIREEKQNKPFTDFKTKSKYEWTKGTIKDVSPAGFCLAFEKTPSNYAESNELVTIQNYKDGKMQYSLGLIRWNRWRNDDNFLVGVELLSPQATPVRTTLDWDYAKPVYHHNGLLLPQMTNIGVDASIILPPMSYRSGQTVAIMTPEQEYKIELTKRVLQTANFIQFQYQPKPN